MSSRQVTKGDNYWRDVWCFFFFVMIAMVSMEISFWWLVSRFLSFFFLPDFLLPSLPVSES